jgi:DNA topoisomerase-2
LEDSGEIVSFTDFSDPGTNNFHFTIKTKRDFTKKKSIEQIMKKFHLIKRVTENFTCIDENNEVREFQNDSEILLAYCDLRLHYYDLRKSKNIQQKQYMIDTMMNKQRFIDDIIKNKLKIKDLKKSEIITYLKNNDYLQKDKSFNYLLNMPIYNISKDQFEKIKKELVKSKSELDMLKNKTQNQMWIDDLK